MFVSGKAAQSKEFIMIDSNAHEHICNCDSCGSDTLEFKRARIDTYSMIVELQIECVGCKAKYVERYRMNYEHTYAAISDIKEPDCGWAFDIKRLV